MRTTQSGVERNLPHDTIISLKGNNSDPIVHILIPSPFLKPAQLANSAAPIALSTIGNPCVSPPPHVGHVRRAALMRFGALLVVGR